MFSEPPEKDEPQPEEKDHRSVQQSLHVTDGSTAAHISQTYIEKLVLSRSETEELNDYLDWALADLENRMSDERFKLLNPPQPEEPFKSLDYFTVDDASIFFGRKAVSKALYDEVLGSRLMILYARSGAGKSSILNAGLSPLLLQESRLPVYVRVHSYEADLVHEIKQAIFPSSRKPWPGLLDRLPLLEFLGLVGMKRQRIKELVIILDQFEQFFISLRNKEIHQAFFEILRDCYEDRILPVRFVISLKHENLADLGDFEQLIPGILQNRFSLPTMSEADVKEAIAGPVQRVNPDVSFEPALLDQLVPELGGEKVELTHLQIVCSQLYSKLPEGQKTITTRLYEEQGRVKEILSTYLDKTLEPLAGYKHKVARDILVELVSSEGTHRILRLPDFEQVVDPDPKVIEDVLEYLVNNRLLRRTMDPEEKRYELAHDYLAEEISQLLGPEQLETKKAQDLLQRELVNHRLFQTYIDPEQLNYLRAHLRFRSLDNPARTLLFESALQHGHEINFWIDQMPDRHEAARTAAAAALGNPKLSESLKMGLAEDLRADVLPVLWDAYHQRDPSQKQRAAEALWILEGWLSPQEKSQIRWALRRIRVEKTVQRSARPAIVVAASILIPLLFWLFFFVPHPIPGKWMDIPAGPFVMGTDKKEAEYANKACLLGALKPIYCLTPDQLLNWSGRQEKAALDDYSIMDNEVTFAQYQLCVDDKRCTPLDVSAEDRGLNLPAAHLTWPQAETYCEWLGGRLPTEAEWEKAARGPDGLYYPWGTPKDPEEWDDTKANLEHSGVKDKDKAASILQYAGTDLISLYSIKNLAGNVEEWTATACFSAETCSKKEGQLFSNLVLTMKEAMAEPGDVKRVIVKGGAWGSARSSGLGSNRQPFDLNGAWNEIGFRCVCPAGAECKSPWWWWQIWLGRD